MEITGASLPSRAAGVARPNAACLTLPQAPRLGVGSTKLGPQACPVSHYIGFGLTAVLEREPGRCRCVLQVSDIGAQAQADPGPDRGCDNVATLLEGQADAADNVGR